MRKTVTFGILALLLSGAAAPTFADVNDAAELSAPDVRGVQRKVAPNPEHKHFGTDSIPI